MDEAHVDAKTHTASRMASGAPLRERKAGIQLTRREVPKGLPQIFYGRGWLAKLTERDRDDLMVSKVAVRFPSRKLLQTEG